MKQIDWIAQNAHGWFPLHQISILLTITTSALRVLEANTAVKRVRMCERWNYSVVCFQAVKTKLPHKSYKQLHKLISHDVLEADNYFGWA